MSFSQIFKKRTFGYLNEEEESLFMILRTFDSFCSSCSYFVHLNSSILTVVTAHGLNQLGLDNSIWPLFVTEMHTNPGRLNCANCDTQTTEPVLRNRAIRKRLLHGRCIFYQYIVASLVVVLLIITDVFSHKVYKFINIHVRDVPVTQNINCIVVIDSYGI